MRDYELDYLFTARTTDGQVWQQTPADRSRLLHMVTLLDSEALPHSEHDVREHPEWTEALAAGRPLSWEGKDWHWHLPSAFSDLLEYRQRCEIVTFRLEHRATPEIWAEIRLLPSGDPAFEAGDLRTNTGRVECNLSSELRPGGRVPPLRLIYGREVTRSFGGGLDPAWYGPTVRYRLGWEHPGTLAKFYLHFV